jgi:hypothetical protein
MITSRSLKLNSENYLQNSTKRRITQIEHLYRSSQNATFVSSRFLEYHKDRFEDFLMIFWDDKLVALCLQTEVEMPFFRIKGFTYGDWCIQRNWRKVVVIWFPLSFERKWDANLLLQTNLHFMCQKAMPKLIFFLIKKGAFWSQRNELGHQFSHAINHFQK